MSALDQESSIFYTIRDKQGFVAKAILHGFNLGTSTLACEAPLPFKQFAGSFGAGVYGVAAKGGGQVLVLGPIGQYAKQDFRHQLLQIDAAATPPTTKVVASIDRLYQPNAGSSTYDASNGVFYTMVTYEEGVEAVAGISVLTGNLVYLTPTTLYTIDFHNGLLLGFGFGVQIDPSNNQPYQIRTLATLNPKNNATAVLMNLTGYATNLPPTALNAETGLLVSILTPQGGEAGNLVSINTTSLKVMSAPQLCAEYDACPWTLAWAL